MKWINNKKKFKQENQKNWANNTEYWLSNPLRQVEDTKIFFNKKLEITVKDGMTIIDMGCGNGWLLDSLTKLNVSFYYIGLDFNSKFISYLKEKYISYSNVSFEKVDFEEGIPDNLLNKADIVYNCFNFFEMADLDTSFNNGVKMLKPNGRLVIFTIEYIYLILAISDTMKEFKSNLKIYEQLKSRGKVPFFFQNIDLGDSESKNLKYASVLYSFNDFFEQALKHQMNLADYGEVVKTSKFLPKTYQYFVFK